MALRLLISGIGLFQIASQQLMLLTAVILFSALICSAFKKIIHSLTIFSELSYFFKNRNIGFCLIDNSFRIRRINDAFLRMLGIEKTFVIGSHCYQVLQSASCLTAKCPLIRTMSGDAPIEIEDYRESGGDEPLAYSVTASPIFSKKGKLIGISKFFVDITERKRIEQTLSHMATHDPLTGLPNRTLFHDRVSQAIARTKRTQKTLAVFFIDLDRFKEINDTFGHSNGDYLLLTISERLQSIFRDTDTVARLGGDEFLILVNEIISSEILFELAPKIIETIRQPIPISGELLQIGASIGWAIYPEDGEDELTLIRHADQAMYRAKKSANNRYQRYMSAV